MDGIDGTEWFSLIFVPLLRSGILDDTLKLPTSRWFSGFLKLELAELGRIGPCLESVKNKVHWPHPMGSVFSMVSHLKYYLFIFLPEDKYQNVMG